MQNEIDLLKKERQFLSDNEVRIKKDYEELITEKKTIIEDLEKQNQEFSEDLKFLQKSNEDNKAFIPVVFQDKTNQTSVVCQSNDQQKEQLREIDSKNELIQELQFKLKKQT